MKYKICIIGEWNITTDMHDNAILLRPTIFTVKEESFRWNFYISSALYARMANSHRIYQYIDSLTFSYTHIFRRRYVLNVYSMN